MIFGHGVASHHHTHISHARPAAAQHHGEADPQAVGLAGFACALCITSAHYAGFVERTDWVSSLSMLSGIALLLACLVHFQNGSTLHATACGIYGSYWLGISLQLISATAYAVSQHNAPGTDPHDGVLRHLDATLTNLRIPMAIFTLYCMVATHQLAKAYVLVYGLFELQLVCLIAGSFSGDAATMKAGGWFGLVSSTLAYYTSAHFLLKPYFTLPLGLAAFSRSSVSASPSGSVRSSSGGGFMERLVGKGGDRLPRGSNESHPQLMGLELSQEHNHAAETSATMSEADVDSTDIESQDVAMSSNSGTRRAVKVHSQKGHVHVAAPQLGRRPSTIRDIPHSDSHHCMVSVVPSAATLGAKAMAP